MDENYWDCSVCIYRNGVEVFKCVMCDVRKGIFIRYKCVVFSGCFLVYCNVFRGENGIYFI